MQILSMSMSTFQIVSERGLEPLLHGEDPVALLQFETKDLAQYPSLAADNAGHAAREALRAQITFDNALKTKQKDKALLTWKVAWSIVGQGAPLQTRIGDPVCILLVGRIGNHTLGADYSVQRRELRRHERCGGAMRHEFGGAGAQWCYRSQGARSRTPQFLAALGALPLRREYGDHLFLPRAARL